MGSFITSLLTVWVCERVIHLYIIGAKMYLLIDVPGIVLTSYFWSKL